MARSRLANSFSNSNFSRRQIALFQKIIMHGNQMAEALNSFDQQLSSKNAASTSKRSSHALQHCRNNGRL